MRIQWSSTMLFLIHYSLSKSRPKKVDRAFPVVFFINEPTSFAMIRIATTPAISSKKSFNLLLIIWLEINWLTVRTGACPVVDLKRIQSNSGSRTASIISFGFCTTSLLSYAWRKVVIISGLTLFCIMGSMLLVIVARWELETCDLFLRLSWLLDTFS